MIYFPQDRRPKLVASLVSSHKARAGFGDLLRLCLHHLLGRFSERTEALSHLKILLNQAALRDQHFLTPISVT
jgi:hypothetical protein